MDTNQWEKYFIICTRSANSFRSCHPIFFFLEGTIGTHYLNIMLFDFSLSRPVSCGHEFIPSTFYINFVFYLDFSSRIILLSLS